MLLKLSHADKSHIETEGQTCRTCQVLLYTHNMCWLVCSVLCATGASLELSGSRSGSMNRLILIKHEVRRKHLLVERERCFKNGLVCKKVIELHNRSLTYRKTDIPHF